MWKINFSKVTQMTTLGTVLLAGLLSTTPLIQSQTHSTPKSQVTGNEDEQFVIKSDVELVLLDVAVKNNKGVFVTGLERQNFEVFEEGRPEPITQFASVDTPVTLGLVVDNSGSMRPKRAEVITAGLAFAEEKPAR